MTSSNNQDQPIEPGTLIPAGLPFAYVSTWAVAGIASLAYLSFAVTHSGSEPPKIETSTTMAQAEEAVLPKLPTVLDRPRVETVRVSRAPNIEEESNAIDSPEAANRIAAQADAEAKRTSPPAASSPIDTKYVTTAQILANSPADEPSNEKTQPPAVPQQTAAANPAGIVTGSITVPPPPDRSPPKPAVLRSTLKPPAGHASSAKKKKIVRKPKPAAPTAAIAFGPAVVTPAAPEPEKPSGLAVLLATGSSVESLRLTWALLQERHSAELANLAPRYIVEANPSAPERKFALLAGPVVSANDIAKVCSALVSEGMTCRTRPYGGNAM